MILLDTNILARSIERYHAHQPVAIGSLALLHSRDHEVFMITPQILAEFYCMATRKENGLGYTTEEAVAAMAKMKEKFSLQSEGPEIFPMLEFLIAKYKPTNRRVFDARHVASMLVYKIPAVLTFNDKDFLPYAEIKVLNPFDVLSLPRV